MKRRGCLATVIGAILPSYGAGFHVRNLASGGWQAWTHERCKHKWGSRSTIKAKDLEWKGRSTKVPTVTAGP